MGEDERSEQACPACGRHTLALDQPPQIDVMGVQPYSDMLGMGDLKNEGALGIVCLSCDTHWRDKDAFERNDPEPEAPVSATTTATEARNRNATTRATWRVLAGVMNVLAEREDGSSPARRPDRSSSWSRSPPAAGSAGGRAGPRSRPAREVA